MQITVYQCDTNASARDQLIEALGARGVDRLDQHNVVLVKDNFSLTFERDILKQLNQSGTFNTDVLSYSRLFYQLLTQPLDQTYLSDSAAIMAIQAIILDVGAQMHCYKALIKMHGFAEQAFQMILLLKCAGVTYQQVQQAAQTKDEYFKRKLLDIALLYQEYQQFLGNTKYDSADKSDMLQALVKQSATIPNSHFFLANFDSYNRLDFRVVHALMHRAKSVTICLVDSGTQVSIANQTMMQMIVDSQLPYQIVPRVSHLNDDFLLLKNTLTNFKAVQPKKTSCVQVQGFNDAYEEVRFVAQEIKKQVMQGKRFSDFAIVCQDLDGYRLPFTTVLNDCNIRYYQDASLHVGEHIAVTYLQLLMQLQLQSDAMMQETVFALAKNPMQPQCSQFAAFENYCLKYGIKGSKFCLPFLKESAEQCQSENLRQALINERNAMQMPKMDTGANFVQLVKEYLSNSNYEQRILEYAKQLQQMEEWVYLDYTRQVYHKLVEVLNEIAAVFAHRYLTLEQFIRIAESGFAAAKISSIPMHVDEVFIGSVNDCKYMQVDQLFIVGANEHLFPVIKEDNELLLQSELQQLKDDFVVQPLIAKRNADQREQCLLTLLLPKLNLTFTYPRVCSDGKEHAPSRWVTRLRQVFFNSDPDNDVRSFALSFTSVSDALEYAMIKKNQATDDKKQQQLLAALHAALNNLGCCEVQPVTKPTACSHLTLAKQLFFGDGRAAASHLEAYYRCPFQHYLQQGLRLKQRELYGFDPMRTGTLLHLVLEKFASQELESVSGKQDSDAVVDKIFSELYQSESYAHLTEGVSEKVRFDYLKQEAKKVCYALLGQIATSNYRVLITEQKFGFHEDQPSLQLTNGVRLSGMIDRVDIDEKRKALRVVDYKTGKVDNGLIQLYLGKKLQLHLYQRALEQAGNVVDGVFYMPVHNDFSETKGQATDMLMGSMLCDEPVLFSNDTKLKTQEQSSVLPIKKHKNGSYLAPESKLHLCTTKQLTTCGDYAERMAKQAVENICQGDIRVLPEATACRYCDYSAICQVDPDTQTVRNFTGKVQYDRNEQEASHAEVDGTTTSGN